MKLRNSLRFTILAFFFVLVVSSSQAADDSKSQKSSINLRPFQQSGVTWAIQPATLTITPGQTSTVEVTISDVVDMGAFDFSLAYDPAVIVINDVTLGTFPSSTGRNFQPLGPTIDNNNGTVNFGAYSLGNTPDGPTGTGTIATIELQTVAVGNSSLQFTKNDVSDKAGNAQPVAQVTDGQVTIESEPDLQIDSTSLSFNGTEGETNPVSQALSISNIGGGTLNWTASTTTASGGNWLTVDSSSGTAPSTLNVSTNISGLSQGTYNGTITLSSNGGNQTVDVTLTVAPPAVNPVLTVNPTSLNFNGTEGASNPVSQALAISNSGTGTLNWTASTTTASGGNWLTVDSSSGTAPSTLNVSTNISGLSQGTYNGTITLSSNGGNQTVDVTLTVAPPAVNPVLTVNPTSLNFNGTEGASNPVSQALAISNSGTGTLNWTASTTTASGGNWLTVDSSSGTAPSTLNVSTNISGLSQGTYNGTITLSSNGGNQTVDVILTIAASANTPPTLVTQIPDQAVDAGGLFLLNIIEHFYDPDSGDKLTFDATLSDGTQLPGWLSLDADSGIFQGTIPVVSSVSTVKVTATDQSGATVSDEFSVLVFTETQNEVKVDENAAGQKVTVADDEALIIELEANPSTGYIWEVDSTGVESPVFLTAEQVEFISTSDKLGAPATQIIRLDPLEANTADLNLVYRRPGTGEVARKRNGNEQRLTIQVETTGDFQNVAPIAPQLEIQSFLPQDPPPPGAAPEVVPNLGLPTTFNWCDQGGCTPVKNQGSCGSCAFFATVGVMESVIKINDGLEKDLSEQMLVSCNTDGWGCDGSWETHKYHYDTQTSINSGPGVVYEEDFPYAAQDLDCKTSLEHQETLEGWGYVNKNKKVVPSVDALKQAIYEYGPISVAVCAGRSFSSYAGGVFRVNEDCENPINHAVVLTGWDDAQEVFIMKNSWGTNWGENGYMNIGYGVSNIGYRASYVIYKSDNDNAPKPPVDLVATVSGTEINLTWTDTSDNETGFRVERLKNGTAGEWEERTSTQADSTTYNDTGDCNTNYMYRVVAFNNNGDSTPSNLSEATTEGCNDLQSPTNLTAQSNSRSANVDDSKIVLSWRDNNSNEDGFLIKRWSGSRFIVDGWQDVATVNADTTSYTDEDVVPWKIYYYVVSTYQGEVYSNWSNQVEGRLVGPKPDPPEGFSARPVSKTAIELQWTYEEGENAESFSIQRWTNGAWKDIATVDADDTSYVDKNLTCDNQYTYLMYATNPFNNSNYSHKSKTRTFTCQGIYLPILLKNPPDSPS